MITAMATGDGGKQIVILGITRANVTRLLAGQPIYVDAATHPGFPTDFNIAIFFGENERAITEQLKPLIDPATKVIAVPREKGQVS
jgi:hypothetical protein